MAKLHIAVQTKEESETPSDGGSMDRFMTEQLGKTLDLSGQKFDFESGVGGNFTLPSNYVDLVHAGPWKQCLLSDNIVVMSPDTIQYRSGKPFFFILIS